jgi:hypothetical protein
VTFEDEEFPDFIDEIFEKTFVVVTVTLAAPAVRTSV